MEIVWDSAKNEILKRERNVSFEEVLDILLNDKELDLIENPTRDGQTCYIVCLNDYVHVVPAVINERNQIILKTIFPSRKYNAIYKGQTNEKEKNKA